MYQFISSRRIEDDTDVAKTLVVYRKLNKGFLKPFNFMCRERIAICTNSRRFGKYTDFKKDHNLYEFANMVKANLMTGLSRKVLEANEVGPVLKKPYGGVHHI